LELILLSRSQQAQARGDDRERITRARQAAEALFTSKPPVSELLAPESPTPTDQSARKPRVLGIISPAAPVGQQVVEASVSLEPPSTPAIPRSQFARIRALVKYGMTVAQVAKVYGAAVGEIDRILHKA
jgi:hypothetical protein